MQSRTGAKGQNNQSQPLRDMRICVLVSNDTSMDSRVKKECAALAEAGAHVTLVGQVGPKPYDGDVSELPYELLLAQKKKIPEWYARWGRETVFYPLRVAVNLSLEPFRRQRHFAAVRPWMLEAVKGRTFDVIHANDFDMLATGERLARRCGAKLVYDSHEIYLAPGRINMTEGQLKALQNKEKHLLQKAAGFITVNPKIADHLVAQYDPPVTPVIIYNGSTHYVDQVQSAHEPLRVLFLGTFEHYFNFPRLIAQMAPFRGKLRLTLQGFDREEGAVQRAIDESGTGDFISVRPPVDTARIIDSIAEFDLGLNNIFPRTLNEVMCSPNKFFDYLSAGLGAVVARQETFLTSVVEETGCGFVYDQKEPEDLLGALDYLVEHPDEVSAMKRNALAAAPRFSWDTQKKKLVSLYQGFR